MDIVLGVSMAPSAVQMVLVEGESADGVTVDQDDFGVDVGTDTAQNRVVSAILGTREGAREGGYRLTSTGVTVSDQMQAGLLRDALADRRIDNVMLVSAFLAAAALAQAVGGAIGYARTALLFVEPGSATTAVIDSADGSITDVHRAVLPAGRALAQLAALAAGLNGLASRPDGLFVVGSGVDVGPFKPQLEAASPLPVSVPEEPALALARGAALASAHAPLFESSTSALAWARDPGTGMLDPELIALGYAYLGGVAERGGDYDATAGELALAYSAVGDNDPYSGYLAIPAGEVPAADDDPQTADPWSHDFGVAQAPRGHKPFLLAGSSLAALFVIGVAALVIALAVSIRPTADRQPAPSPHIVVPTQQAPAPAVQVPAPPPSAPAPPPPSVLPKAPPPVEQPVPAVRPAPAPEPQAPAPAPVPEAPAPAPVPEAPAPIPAAPAPVPAPIPIPVPVPRLPIPIVTPAPAQVAPQAPKLPSLFNPPKQSQSKNDDGPSGGVPGWPGNSDGKDGSNPWLPNPNGGGSKGGSNPWLPNGGGSKGGSNPWLPGGGGSKGGSNPWLPGGGGSKGGSNPWLPNGGGSKGGSNPWLPGLGSGHSGGGGGLFGGGHKGFGF